jgi:LPPG:FO 2-phospho-L-lactate transferase
MITVLSGGVGAGRFLQGLVQVVPQKDVTIVSNTGDDLEVFGLHVSPDIDIVIYHLASEFSPDRPVNGAASMPPPSPPSAEAESAWRTGGGGKPFLQQPLVNEETGWGLAGDTFHALDALAHFGHETWFALGDRDLATSIHRTHLLRQGRTLSQATAEVARAFGLAVTILPMSDEPVRTKVETPDGLLDFQEYMVKRGARDAFRGLKLAGIEDAKPAPGVIEAITSAEGVIIAPSNPIVSIGPILALPGVRAALRQTEARVVAVSPIVGGAVLKGPAAKMLEGLRMEVSAWQVGWLYQDFLDCLVIDVADADDRARIEALGLDVVVADTIMKGMEEKAALARRVVQATRGPRIQARHSEQSEESQHRTADPSPGSG